MTDLAAHGIEVSLARRAGKAGCSNGRSPARSRAAAADGAPAAPGRDDERGACTSPTIALPPGTGDFASGAVDKLGSDDVLDRALRVRRRRASTQPLFKRSGPAARRSPPTTSAPTCCSAPIRGQAGVQRFFQDQGRAFCLYVVIGSFARRQQLVKRVNDVLGTLTIEPLDADREPADEQHDRTPTTEAPTTELPTTERADLDARAHHDRRPRLPAASAP